jgi:hypothetical protein
MMVVFNRLAINFAFSDFINLRTDTEITQIEKYEISIIDKMEQPKKMPNKPPLSATTEKEEKI